MLKLNNGEILMIIKGYEQPTKRYNGDDDSWAKVEWIINNGVIDYKTASYDLESVEIDEMRDMFKDFLNNKITKDYDSFISLEPVIKLIFYPKGSEYGLWIDSLEKKNPIESPEVELLIPFIDDKGQPLDSYYSYFLSGDEIKEFYNYLEDITSQ